MNLFRIGQVYSENGNTHWRIDSDGMTVVKVLNSSWVVGQRYAWLDWKSSLNNWIEGGVLKLIYDKEDNVKKILSKIDESERA